jgi:hypothetical protein
MIPKSGNRFSEKIMLKKSNDPEKWEPVSRLRAALSNRLHFRLMLLRAKTGRKTFAQTKKAGAE